MRRVFTSRLCLLPLLTTLGTGCDLPKGDGDSDTDTSDPSESDTGEGTGGTEGGTDAGTGGDTGTADTGVQPTDRAVDIIFVVDNSGSMGEEQARLANSISSLVDALDAAVPPVDYRIAVTTTDNGNPWCQGTTPEAGTFRATSCRERTNEFVFQGAQEVDVIDEACLDLCPHESLDLSVPWIDVDGATGSSNVPSGDVAGALRCLLPQGIDGCGFEQPLESLRRALDRVETLGDSNNGFRRPGALLAVAMVTDEVDCSHNPAHETIFLPDGSRVFWSNQEDPAPTSALCWNAGVSCTGSGTYDDCHAVDLNVDGNAVAGDPEIDAVLRPLTTYIDQLSSEAVYMVALNGVADDGSVVYADTAADPDFQNSFGIGPGCSGSDSGAVPPVRIRELVETVSGPGNLHSVCDEDYSPALAAMASGILDRLP